MRDQLYERLAPEWRATLASGAYLKETDESFYSGSTLWKTEGPKSPLQIIKMVADRLDVTTADILSRHQTKEASRARFMAIRLVREAYPNMTLEETGAVFGRDRATISNADKRALEIMRYDPKFRNALYDLRRQR